MQSRELFERASSTIALSNASPAPYSVTKVFESMRAPASTKPTAWLAAVVAIGIRHMYIAGAQMLHERHIGISQPQTPSKASAQLDVAASARAARHP